MISVYNNGKGIPIEMHKELNLYVPEMLFGQLIETFNFNNNNYEKKVRGLGKHFQHSVHH